MTVQELIEKLQTRDPAAEVNVVVRTFTQSFAVAHVSPFEVDDSYGGCAIWISLPQNMYTVKRKAEAALPDRRKA